jgi:integrase
LAGICKPAQFNGVPASISEEIFNTAIFLHKKGLSEHTIKSTVRNLKQLSQLCDLNNIEEVKTTIANQKQWQNSTKLKFVNEYTDYLKSKGQTWEKPIYKKQEKIPFIPTEQEIDQLIASCGKKQSTLIQFLKDTGARSGEAFILKWIDINFESKTVNITPEKGSNPRILPLTDKTIQMLNQLNRNRETIFPHSLSGARTLFCAQRNRTAKKLQNPRIKKITFHTLRHYKATMEYHKTKDIIHVKYILGHKCIDSTMVYINIEQALFLQDTDDWNTIVTHNLTEELKAINANFTLVRAINETTAIYKKRK